MLWVLYTLYKTTLKISLITNSFTLALTLNWLLHIKNYLCPWPLLNVVDRDISTCIFKYISEKFTVSQLTKVKWLQECRIWNINSGASWTSLFGHWFSFHRCRCYYGFGKILANYKWNINSFCKICKQYFSTNNV